LHGANKTKKNKHKGFIHDVLYTRWHGLFELVDGKAHQTRILQNQFSFALIRDPKERLISAWKSKIACGHHYGTNTWLRASMTRVLLKLAGRDTGEKDRPETADDCLMLTPFLEALRDVHRWDKAWLLNAHYLPQTMGCFANDGPENWTYVVDIASEEPLRLLAEHLRYDETAGATHQSTAEVVLCEKDLEILDEITLEEYKVLGPYLTRPSKAVLGASV